jgi:uncharacterized protein
MEYAAGTPSWTDLMTPTPQRTRDFYAELFGWTYTVAGPEYGYYATALQGAQSVAGITPTPPDTALPSAWTVYFASDDLAADAARVQSLGGAVLAAPMQVGNQGHMGLFTDPTGAAFGLWQALEHRGAQATAGQGVRVWAEVNTHDSARALAFYTGLFGAQSTPLPGLDYHQLHHGALGEGEGGYAGVSGNGEQWDAVVPAHWVAYFYVEDVDASAQVAQAQGGRVLVAPFDTPFGCMAVLADPAGATFSVMTPALPEAEQS